MNCYARRKIKTMKNIKTNTTVVRKYYVSFAQLRDALGLKGELHESNLWTGLSPQMKKDGVSRDKEIVEIITHEDTGESV